MTGVDTDSHRHVDPFADGFLSAWSIVRAEEGFTLMELIMVIVIIGMMATSAISIVPDDLDRVGWARQLVGDLRVAQSYAMNRGVDYCLHRINDNSYEICDTSCSGASVPGSLVTVPGIVFSAFDILFDRLGQPTGSSAITLTEHGHTSTVTVLATTELAMGHIQAQEP